MSIGRVAHWYDPLLYQGNINPGLNSDPISGQVKSFRWHPHLSGFLLSPHDKHQEARAAHRKFQEISRRETHELRVHFQPGDLFIWDNHRLLHGREQVLRGPRTSVAQTVPEQIRG
jgi:trimethyllysine dioxygenase